MSNQNEHDVRADVDATKHETWRQRHGVALLMGAFGLLTILMVVYEKLSH